jgi:hypothetical protein
MTDKWYLSYFIISFTFISQHYFMRGIYVLYLMTFHLYQHNIHNNLLWYSNYPRLGWWKSPSSWLLYIFGMHYPLSTPYFVAQKIFWTCIVPSFPQPWISSFSQATLVPFSGQRYFQTTIWMSGTRCAQCYWVQCSMASQ